MTDKDKWPEGNTCTETMYKVEYQHYDKDDMRYVAKVVFVHNITDIYQYRSKITNVTPMNVEWLPELTSETIAELIEQGDIDNTKQRLQQQINSKNNDLAKLQEQLDKIG